RSLIRSRIDLQLENLALRHQIGVLQRSLKKRPKLTSVDRLLWVSLSRIWRDWRSTVAIVKPQTVVAWHCMGFRLNREVRGNSKLTKVFTSIRHLRRYAPFKNFTPHFHIPSISLTFAMRPDTKIEGAFFTSSAYGTAI